MLFEVCLESAESAKAAQEAGAHRVELCAALREGGLTPSAGAIAVARRAISIKLHVIIRPRPGDFCFSPLEFECMRHDIDLCKQLGADGVVIGLLTPAGDVDLPRTRELVQLARPLSVTFHRAFDMARDPVQALESLIELGVDRILTSGQESSALEGMELIAALIRRAAGRIVVMPGGGIHERNIARIAAGTGAQEIHIAAMQSLPSRMEFRNPRCYMGGELRPDEFSLSATDSARVRAMIAAVG